MPRHFLRRQPASIQPRDRDAPNPTTTTTSSEGDPNPNTATDSAQAAIAQTNRGTRSARHGTYTTPTPSQFQTPPQRAQDASLLQSQSPRLHPTPSAGTGAGAGAGGLARSRSTAAAYSLFGRGVATRQGRGVGVTNDNDVDVDEDEDEGGEGRGEEGGEEDEIEDETYGAQRDAASYSGLFTRYPEGVDDDDDDGEEGDDDDEEMVGEDFEEDEDGEDVDVDEGEDEDAEEDEMMNDEERTPSPLPPNLREISSLASWTVSTHKPGCGVSALRHPSPLQYWQSDGSQPHSLTLHFFKLVAVVKIRVYLDFELDESYTPTKMVFLAGMGGNDLVEFATWEGEGPFGWVDIPLEGVGGRSGGWVVTRPRMGMRKQRKQKKQARRGTGTSHRQRSGTGADSAAARARTPFPANNNNNKNQPNPETTNTSTSDEDSSSTSTTSENLDDNMDLTTLLNDPHDPYAGNVLKAMVIQMLIVENHQNGKDTHVRGFQVFASDDDRYRMNANPSASASASANASARRQRPQHASESAQRDEGRHRGHHHRGGGHRRDSLGDVGDGTEQISGLRDPEWMGDFVIR